MSLTRKDIEEIMALLEASRFDRLNLEMDGVKLELVRSGAGPRSAQPSAPAPAPTPAPAPQATLIPAPANVSRAPAEGLVEVKSPLLGIYYRAPKPGEPSFVEVGDRVEPDTIIGIVEVMKLMNSARAGVAGTVVEILGQNGELVEHGEVLLLVKPD
ncbi:MAG: acetyl-CoA carboxylase biotin carboxyl carrier protein [Croceibacterium sp.]